jgi:hypothetical protein
MGCSAQGSLIMGGIIDAILGGGDKPSTPQVVPQDPKADAAKSEAEAASKANAARIATKRAKAGGSSLLASGAKGVGGTAETSSALATGKTTLGQ